MMNVIYIKRDLILLVTLLVILSTLPAEEVFGQHTTAENLEDLPGRHNEVFALFTDRNMYIVGEKIYFSVYNLSDAALKDIGWSTVLYVELVSSEKEPVVQDKFRLQKDGMNGYVLIPLSILSGTYYLRAYTRWMKNSAPENYAYSRIKIVNPEISEVSPVLQDIPGARYQNITSLANPVEGISVKIETDKDEYGQRSRVQVSYNISGVGSDELAGLCLTVVREAAVDKNVSFEYLTDATAVGNAETKIYIPETRGLAITGEVIDKIGKSPVPNARVQLSVIGDDPDYFGYLTGDDGRFYITLPDYTGLKDFYISAEMGTSTDIEILIDKDYSTRFVDFNTKPFRLSEDERSLAEEMMRNVQVESAYQRKITSGDSILHEAKGKSSFYGTPLMTVKTDEFVRLPSLEEFIYEVVPTVTVNRTGGQKELKFFGDYSDLDIYKPLILLDHVAISDLSAVLAVPPDKIDHLDVINASYIRGNINYGGIISIFSRMHDLAGVDLPDQAYFFGLKTLSAQENISFPDYEIDQGNLRDPDFRNCLIWLPDLTPDEDGSGEAYFYTADKKGEYLIYLRGITTDGQLLTGRSKIYVE